MAMMFRNRTINKTRRLRDRKILAVVLAAAVTFAYAAAPAYAASDITKEETVYVVTDATGAEEDVIVSDHLKNDIEADTIEDATDLTEIENVKGEETFSQGKGDQIIWNAKGSDIFYEGVSSRETPVTMDISYKLDGEKVDGSQLEGKSGAVEIKIDFKNRAKVNEGGREITVPFIAMCGFIASDDTLQDIEIDHGKVIDDGDKKIVVGMAAPGIADALDIDLDKYDIDLSDSIRITANAKGYDIQDIMTVVTNSVFEDIDTEEMNLDFDDEVNALDDGAKALMEGTEQLYAGISQLNDKSPELKGGIDTLKNNLTSLIPKLIDGTSRLKGGSKDVLGGLKKIKAGLEGDGTAANPGAIPVLNKTSEGLKGGASNLRQKANQMQGAETASKALNQYMQQVKTAVEDNEDVLRAKGYGALVDQTPGMAQAAAGLADGLDGSSDALSKAADSLYKEGDPTSAGVAVGAVASGLKDASNALGSYDKNASTQTTLIGGQTEIYNGLSEMNSQLSSKYSKLDKGLGKLSSGAGALVEGTKKLDRGSLELSKGMSRYYNEGIKQLVDLYHNDIKGSVDGLRDMINAGQDYRSFTKLPKGMDGNVKFIYKTSIY